MQKLMKNEGLDKRSQQNLQFLLTDFLYLNSFTAVGYAFYFHLNNLLWSR